MKIMYGCKTNERLWWNKEFRKILQKNILG